MVETIAQIFGIIGLILNIFVYQQKKQNIILICQFFASIAWVLNFILLGAIIGGVLNFIGAIRSVVFYFEKQTKANSLAWFIFFISAFVLSYPLTFIVAKTPVTIKNLIVEILPVIAMILATISLRIGSPKAVRMLGIAYSPMWLTYNCFSGSIGAISSEIITFVSIIIGVIRLDIKKMPPKQKDALSETENLDVTNTNE